ncbi:MAG: phosphoglucomutase, alpha-D-glucose phosphate-specific [Synergistales bacterium]|nr:phosphoglucomutase, alpha-D-glucose phosphate-specific [Synergistales bacterium]
MSAKRAEGEKRQGEPVQIPKLVAAYYTATVDAEDPAQRVSFGTSGHRGSSLKKNFNEQHILAISQAIAEFRWSKGIQGPLFLGKDTHALSEPAAHTAVEVLAANGVAVVLQQHDGYTPTPVISHAILSWSRSHNGELADGIVITPSHNPPGDGGFKYNPPSAGPAGNAVTAQIEKRANELLKADLAGVKRVPLERALRMHNLWEEDLQAAYIEDLHSVVDMERIAQSGLTMCADALGGAGLRYWERIAERYGLSIDVLHDRVDPTFSFMPPDHDGAIRMDCSSPYAMEGLIELKDRYDLAFGNDPDFDRHGIVTRQAGLLQPNAYLAVAVWHLFTSRNQWPDTLAAGKTAVTTSLIDRIAAGLQRPVYEVPVGFKWFVDPLLQGKCACGCEESAGASFLRRDGNPWTTDKDGIVMCLLAAEIMSEYGEDLAALYDRLCAQHGKPVYRRVEAPATREQKERLKSLRPRDITCTNLAGERVLEIKVTASGDGNPLGGVQLVTEHGWLAVRPSGTEDLNKMYAESFLGEEHVDALLQKGNETINEILQPR